LLLALLRSCNRSAQHLPLLTSTMVALHALVCPLPTSTGTSTSTSTSTGTNKAARLALLCEDALATLLDVLQMFRDKRNVFVLCCDAATAMLVACEATSAFRVRVCAEHRGRVQGIYTIMDRKARIDARLLTLTAATAGAGAAGAGAGAGEERDPLVALSALLAALNKAC
jgi:hypothetical protein